MTEKDKIQKSKKAVVVANVLGGAFAIFSVVSFYLEKDYWISGLMSILGILFIYKLVKPSLQKSKSNFDHLK